MVEKEQLTELIRRIGNSAFFVGKADDLIIQQIETKLNVILPVSYEWFLREFGHGGMMRVEILGNGLSLNPSCVTETEFFRESGLPMHLVVIENVGEWIFCLDTSRMVENECPVVDWDSIRGLGNIYYETFLDFIYERFLNASKSG